MALPLASVHPIHCRRAMHAHLPGEERHAEQHARHSGRRRCHEFVGPARLARHHSDLCVEGDPVRRIPRLGRDGGARPRRHRGGTKPRRRQVAHSRRDPAAADRRQHDGGARPCLCDDAVRLVRAYHDQRRLADNDHGRHGFPRQFLQRLRHRERARLHLLFDRRSGGVDLRPAKCRRRGGAVSAATGWLWRGGLLGLLSFAIFAPLANLVLWAVAIQWYYPHKLPLTYGFRYWGEVFKPTSDAFASLGTSVLIATITVVVCLLLAIPAGYALSRRRLPARGIILLILLLPQAFPSVAIYFNIARLFYMVGLNGTIAGVVLVHAVHGLVIAVWIAAAAFAAVDAELELAARNIGASALRTALTVTLPLAAPALMAAAIFV